MIKILTANGTELPYLKDSLSIRGDNNAFKDSFSLDYSEYPFIIEETPEVIRELGPSEINSTLSKKEIDITLILGPDVYFGKLKVQKYLTGARQCIARFSKKFVEILDKKIRDFMPTYHFGDQIPYTETVEEYFDQSQFSPAVSAHLDKQYPEVDFCLPQINVGNYFQGDKDWELFTKTFNFRGGNELFLNSFSTVNNVSQTVRNVNSFVPMPYLMSMLRNPVENSGYKLAGSFVENPFNQKIIHVPNVNNNTALKRNQGLVYTNDDFWFVTGSNFANFRIPHSDLEIGTYNVNYKFLGIPPHSSNGRVTIQFKSSLAYGEETIYYEERELDFSNGDVDLIGSFSFDVTPEKPLEALWFLYEHTSQLFPDTIEIKVQDEREDLNLYLFHPTVELARYVPDWTIGQLINELKNFQNLEVDFDDVTNTLSLNYNAEYLKNNTYLDLSNDVVSISSKTNRFENKHKISYANESSFVYLERGRIESNIPVFNQDVTPITNSFKLLGYNGFTTETTKEEMEKDGLSLALFNGNYFTEDEIDGFTLSLEGDKGLVATYWQRWINFRQRSKLVEAEAHLTALQISKLKRLKKVYFDKRMYAVVSHVIKPKTSLSQVKLELENIVESVFPENVVDVNPRINITAFTNAPFPPISFVWSITVTYSYVDIFSFDGTIRARQLEDAPGSNYTGFEFTANVDQVNGTVNFILPIFITTEAGWYEIYLEDNGITSNVEYIEIPLASDPNVETIKLTNTGPASWLNNYGTYTLDFENYDEIPNSVEVWLQKIQGVTPVGLPIKTTLHNVDQYNYDDDNNLPEFTVYFPTSGIWRITVRDGLVISNEIGWTSIQI